MSNATLPANMPSGDPYAGVPPLGQRVGQGVLVWLAFVLPVGLATMPPNSGAIGFISGVIAGCIVLLPVGAVVGAMGATWRFSLAGGVVGGLAGLAAFLAGALSAPNAASLLIM